MIIILIVVAVLLLIGTTVLLYFTTDFMKSNERLFYKYVSQDVDALIDIVGLKEEKDISNYLKQVPYEENSEVIVSSVKNANTNEEDRSDEINNLKLTIEGQKDYPNKYNYKNIKILKNGENLFRTEYIRDNDFYGIRFSDIFIQFLVVENNNLKTIAQNAGVTQEIIDKIPNEIGELDLMFSDDELQQLKNNYLNIIINNISSDNYTKMSNAMITVNGQSLTTKAYILKIKEEQLNEIYVKILEKLKDDEIVMNKISELQNNLIFSKVAEWQNEANMKIVDIDMTRDFKQTIEEKIEDIKNNNISSNIVTYTVYQSKGNTIRTVIDKNVQTTIIDLNNEENKKVLSIERNIANTEAEDTTRIQISKTTSNDRDLISITYEKVNGEEISKSEFTRNRTVNGMQINTQTILSNQDSKQNKFEITYNQSIDIVSDMQRKLILDESNEVILNQYNSEVLVRIYDLIKEELQKKAEENQELINKVINGIFLGTGNELVIENTDKPSELEVNRFNSKFEFSTGNEVDYKRIEQLLDIAKDDLEKVQVAYSEDETKASNSKKNLKTVRLTIQKGMKNYELAQSVLELMEKNKKYTVTLETNPDNGMVQYIIITVNG